MEVSERVRPYKAFEEGKINHERLVTGINQEKYVIEKYLDIQKVEEDLNKLYTEKGL